MKPKANFIVAEIKNNKMNVKGDYSSLEIYDILPRNLIETNQLFIIQNTSAIRELVNEKYFLINKKTYLVLILLSLVFIYLIFRLKNK